MPLIIIILIMKDMVTLNQDVRGLKSITVPDSAAEQGRII